jgi:GTP cyclohydrolase I
MGKQVIDFAQLHVLAEKLSIQLRMDFGSGKLNVYPVPRGGVPVALILQQYLNCFIVDEPELANFVVDDLIDTGATKERFGKKPFYALIDKRTWQHGQDWVVWPWENSAESGITDHIVRLIQYIGDDPTRGGLLETPDRVAKAWQYWGGGYGQDPKDILKVFEDGAEGVDEMVMVKDIPFYTHCEHHMAPFFGTATIAYLPEKKIVGISKLSRVLDIFARRLQVQERLTCQVADALMEHLQPMGCGVLIKARHLCMESRGVKQQGHHTVTSALRGIFKKDRDVRAEFLALARNNG